MSQQTLVDAERLRAEVRSKYRAVATDPDAGYHFHTGRGLAARLGYDAGLVDALPDVAVESFAGVANPLALRPLAPGERVVDVGSGAGFDSFMAAAHVGTEGHVVGVDMTAEMLAKSRATAGLLGLDHVEFREGLAEQLPVPDGWADAVISNGVINLCADKRSVFAEVFRVLRPGGVLQFADIANGRPCPRRPSPTSTCGPAESPVACRVQAGSGCWRRPASSTSASARRWTPSVVPAVRPTPGRMRSSVTPSWPASRRRDLHPGRRRARKLLLCGRPGRRAGPGARSLP